MVISVFVYDNKNTFSWEWSLFSKTNSVYNALYEISAIGLSPLWIFILELVLLFLTLTILHITLSVIYTITKKAFIVSNLCWVFIWGIVGFKLLPNNYAFYLLLRTFLLRNIYILLTRQ